MGAAIRKLATLVVVIPALLCTALPTGVALAATPVSGYEVVQSPPLVFGDGGFGGWSCPVGKTVLAGGFEATDPVSVSVPGTPGSVWPHHVFGPAESGWVVQDDVDGVSNAITIYVICADAPPGYEIENSPPMAFGDGGYGGWSCPAGKVVLGGGFLATDPVAVSAPGTPGSVWPHYTFSPNEYGWVIRDDPNGFPNLITVYAICADAPSGYVVVNSPPMAFGDGGYGGWSCPAGKAVLGGGFDAIDTVVVSAPGTPGSVWPHYTFGPNEYGWVVRDDPNGAPNTITIYAICADVLPEQPESARVKGAGQVDVDELGGKGTFGFNARLRSGVASGHLHYRNHVTGVNLNCRVTEVLILGPTKAQLSGPCDQPNDEFDRFEADVEDNGKNNKDGSDRFRIRYCDGAVCVFDNPDGAITRGDIKITVPDDEASASDVTAADETSQPAGATFNGVTLSGLNVGMGLSIASSGAGAGQFVAVVHGKSPLGQPRRITVDGEVGGGSIGPAGSLTFSGIATVDMGDGTVPLLNVPFTATTTTQSLLLSLGASTLPSVTLTQGSITIE
jgi:hypothetical protein